ncbi:substrate-binding periplasmic protein [Neogemmobacter tilapiae]|uniref:Amino acid ABC transporter substrate-binding protein n=1 Tax=Neogemmobacter tilapiae TaxID=875041 RepID=A0A918TS44_9RHOB|nr:transporter substrate-binding domain-containing protein [Gemmobacter tilapiae]GHC59708.1 amino acid ABC transporter substrate-binding protein [Gemmobacter tilapiae]
MACLAQLSALAMGMTLVNAETTVIGTEAPFPPYTFIAEDGQITGFDRAVGDEACLRAGLVCTWVNMRFDRLMPGVMSGDIDIAMGGIAKTAERMALVDFTMDYSFSDGLDNFVGRSGAPEPDQALIGVQAGTIQEQHLRKTGRNFISYGTEGDLLEALIAQKVDLAFGAFYAGTVSDLFAENGIEWLYEEDAGENGIGMAVCKENKALLAQLNKALKSMQDDGTIDALSDEWF